MASAHLYQIFYSPETRRELDSDFIPLDNLANARPDWREYWPMRNFLLGEKLIDSDFYGFFSPRFKQKTNISAARVKQFILEPADNPDVVIFSPMWDLSALFLNVFEQAEALHPGILVIAQEFFDRTNSGIHLSDLMTDSRNTAFCNYFAAKPPFWRAWLEINEKLFAMAESAEGELGQKLISTTKHREGTVQMKIFIMERIATLILATNSQWKSKAFNPFRISQSTTGLNAFPFEAVLSDALKIAYTAQKTPEYKGNFLRIREQIQRAMATGKKPL